MKSLSKLFGSIDRVRILRMFLFNPNSVYSVNDIAKRTDSLPRIVDKEVSLLQKSGLIRKKPFLKLARNGNDKTRRGSGWVLDKNFAYLKPLESLLIQQSLIKDQEIIKRFANVAKLKLLAVAGIFIQDPESRVDILLVGDHFKKANLDRVIKSLEADIGKEVRYAAFETPEFKYRISMYDKLVRDIFDYPHKKILNKIGLVND